MNVSAECEYAESAMGGATPIFIGLAMHGHEVGRLKYDVVMVELMREGVVEGLTVSPLNREAVKLN